MLVSYVPKQSHYVSVTDMYKHIVGTYMHSTLAVRSHLDWYKSYNSLAYAHIAKPIVIDLNSNLALRPRTARLMKCTKVLNLAAVPTLSPV